ncbi:MAG: hypothetical protein JRJ77_13300 [Deltaproteobacteria bacterium]|nr:hypothetical protein [Deltaproteobacteria bacterium]
MGSSGGVRGNVKKGNDRGEDEGGEPFNIRAIGAFFSDRTGYLYIRFVLGK